MVKILVQNGMLIGQQSGARNCIAEHIFGWWRQNDVDESYSIGDLHLNG